MRHLAIECSAIGGSVSLLDGPNEVRSLSLESNVGSIQGLAALTQKLLTSDGAVTVPPTLISVTTGPGSFTGIRVGLATVKSLAFAWKIPVVSVDTLHAIARRIANASANARQPFHLVTVINAFRKQVFAAGWQVVPGGCMHQKRLSQVVDASRWVEDPWGSLSQFAEAPLYSTSTVSAEANCSNQPVYVSGPGLRNYTPATAARCELVLPELWEPRSQEVGQIGWEKLLRGEVSSAISLAANYLRSSAAEEKK